MRAAFHPVALAVACAAGPALAQGTVRVQVVDQRGGAVALADVTIAGAQAGGQDAAALLTGDDGYVAITLPAADPDAEGGATTVTASATGFTPRTLTLADLARAGYRFVLQAEPGAGGDIVVQGRRVSSAYAPQAIGKLEILTDPLARADALLAVANLPGSTNGDATADIQLRGSATALSRAYFNDVPLYEVVRGSPVDRATRGFSVFNSSIVQDVEVYPSNPPLYLANASGGAVRILPDDAATASSTVYASLAGAGLTRTIPLGGDPRNQVQLYATVTELAPLLAVNPALRDVTRSFRAGAVGASSRYHPDDDTRIGLLTIIDGERGRYPLLYLGRSSGSTSDRLRNYNILSVERALGEVRLKVDMAYTDIRGRQVFDAYATRTHNRYGYLSTDLARSLPAPFAEVRAGLASAMFDLSTRGAGTAFTGAGGTPGLAPGFDDRQRAGQTSAFGYVTLRPLGPATLAFGIRAPVVGTARSASYQSTTTVRLGEGHRLILGAGRYASLAVPDAPTVDRLAPAISEQASVDYRFDRGALHLSLGVYAKRDAVAGRITRVRGFDAQLSASLADWLSLSGSLTSARPRVRERTLSYRADNDLPYLIRLTARAEISTTTALAASFVGRRGTPYTALAGALDGPGGGLIAVPATPPNQQRLGDYRTVDLNLTNIMTWWPGPTKPIGFASLTNLLDRRNESRIDTDPRTLSRTPLFYQRRALTLGLVFQL